MKKRILSGLMALSLVLTACSTGSKAKKDIMDNKKEHKKMEDKMDHMKSDKKDNMKLDQMSDSTKVKKINQGELATDFNLPDINGKMYKLSDQKGKKVYVKFWASWCPICLAGLSELDEMSKNAKDYEIVTVVSPGHIGEKNKEDFIKWFKGLNYKNIKVLLDESGNFIKNYGIRSTPTNIIVGSDGVLIKVVPGQLNKEALNKIFSEVK